MSLTTIWNTINYNSTDMNTQYINRVEASMEQARMALPVTRIWVRCLHGIF